MDLLINRFCTTKSAEAPDAPYRYFGIESGLDCQCGNSFKHTFELKVGECNIACSGNNAQSCGGVNRIDVWENSEWLPVSSSILSWDHTDAAWGS
jgi:hypothetical protein